MGLPVLIWFRQRLDEIRYLLNHCQQVAPQNVGATVPLP